MNGYNFTERVRKVLAMAREESARLHHEYVGTEHILLGILHEAEGVAATVLANLSVEADEMELKIAQIIKSGRPGKHVGPDLPYTSRAKKVLEFAMSEARELNHTYVGTEHLLLGLLREEKGIAAQVLNDSGVSLETARAETLRILGTEMTAQTRTRSADRPTAERSEPFGILQLSDRLRDVMSDAEHVATEFRAAQLSPVHFAIALVRHGEGMANAVMDRLECDCELLARDLESMAKGLGGETISSRPLEFGQYMLALQHYIASEARWRSSGPTTLHALLALLDTDDDVAKIFERAGVTANQVRTEARKISG